MARRFAGGRLVIASHNPGKLVEIQATAEEAPFAEEQFAELLRLARKGIAELTRLQRAAVTGL